MLKAIGPVQVGQHYSDVVAEKIVSVMVCHGQLNWTWTVVAGEFQCQSDRFASLIWMASFTVGDRFK